MLNPTTTTVVHNSQGHNHIANDVTVAMSNCRTQHVEDDASTTDTSREDEQEEYCPPTQNIQRPKTLTFANKNKAWHQLHQANHAEDCLTTVQNEHAISDLGATGHSVVKNAPVTNKRIAHNPIAVTLSNRKTIKSIHTCNLDIPWLPHAMTEAHIVPGLTHSSLISTQTFAMQDAK